VGYHHDITKTPQKKIWGNTPTHNTHTPQKHKQPHTHPNKTPETKIELGTRGLKRIDPKESPTRLGGTKNGKFRKRVPAKTGKKKESPIDQGRYLGKKRNRKRKERQKGEKGKRGKNFKRNRAK